VKVMAWPGLIFVLLAVNDEIDGAKIAFTVALPVTLAPAGFVTVQVSVQVPGVLGGLYETW